jgi:hypothetical protein
MADDVMPRESRRPLPDPEPRKAWTTPRLVVYGTLIHVTRVDSASGLPH